MLHAHTYLKPVFFITLPNWKADYVPVMSKMYTVLVGKPKGNSSLDGHSRSWKNIIKLYLIELGYWDVDYIHVAQDSDQWKHVYRFRDLQRSVRSQHRVACIMTWLRAGRFGVQMPAEARDFYFLQKRPERLWGSHRLLLNGCPGSFPGVKQPGREVRSRSI
jgi:hypothetical protein